MSLVNIVLYSMVGFFLGFGFVLALAGKNDGLRDTLLRKIVRSNPDGWVWEQRGEQYKLRPLTYDEGADQYRIGSKEDAEYKDEVGLMHSFKGVPFGLALKEKRPMVDIETAAAAEGASKMIPDGGNLSHNQTLTPDEIQDRLGVGRLHGERRTIQYVNPFIYVDKEDLVDLRKVTKLLRYNSNADTPRKTAKNAQEAERAFDSYGGLRKNLGRIAYLMIGGILTYIGTTSGGGGGGGGGGVSVPIQLVSDGLMGVVV